MISDKTATRNQEKPYDYLFRRFATLIPTSGKTSNNLHSRPGTPATCTKAITEYKNKQYRPERKTATHPRSRTAAAGKNKGNTDYN